MDAPTIGVLRDMSFIVWLALLAGVLAYQVLRIARPEAVVSTGKVQTHAFESIDAVIVSALSVLFFSSLHATEGAAGSAGAEAEKALELTLTSVLGNMVFQLGLCMALLVYLNLIRGLPVAHLFGLGQVRLRWVLIIAVLVMLPLLLLVNGAAFGLHEWMKAFWPDLKGQDVAEAFRAADDPLIKVLMIVSAAIIAPLVEEIVFRGFIYGVIKRYTDGIFAALCSSLFFAVIHLHVGTLFPLTLLALAFCFMYERTGSLLVPMTMHALFNATSLTVMIFFPELEA